MRDRGNLLLFARVRIFCHSFFPFWYEWQRYPLIDQVAVGGDFVFCRVVRSEVNGGVGCCRFSVYINFYFWGLSDY
jgi:hypothetical protein